MPKENREVKTPPSQNDMFSDAMKRRGNLPPDDEDRLNREYEKKTDTNTPGRAVPSPSSKPGKKKPAPDPSAAPRQRKDEAALAKELKDAKERNEAARARAEKDSVDIVMAALSASGAELANILHGPNAPTKADGLRKLIELFHRTCLDGNGNVMPFAREQPYLAQAICDEMAFIFGGGGISLLAHIVEKIPHEVKPEIRRDKRLLPVVRITETRPERQRGQLFGGLLDGRELPQLPLFPGSIPARKSVAILDIADASGLPVMAQGRGAPLPLRLFVNAGLSVAPQDRKRESVRITLTIRELRDGLFPGRNDMGKYWPKLRDALMSIRDYTIRIPDGGLWFMLALRRLPDVKGNPSLDDHVVLDVAFPPGASDGPPVDLPALNELGVRSGPGFRAYIAAKALVWLPGRTQRPVPGVKGRFGWSRDKGDYPVITRADMKRLAFGENDKKNRTREEVESAWRDLPGVVLISNENDPRTGETGWRIMPSEVAPEGGQPEKTRR